MSTKPTIVFVPGAWHAPSGFRLVREALHSRGWSTEAVSLPSVGAEPPTKGIPDDEAAVRSVLEPLIEEGKQVVLVVHSYGSLPGGHAVRGLGYQQRQKDGKAGGVITILYLAAFAALAGQSLYGNLGGKWLPWFRVEGTYVYAETPEEILYHDVPADLQSQAIADLKHECSRAWTDEVEYEPWHDIHCLYFVCEEDRAIPAPLQNQMASMLGPDSVIFRSQSSHSPFLSAVQDTVDGIEKAVESGLKRVA